MLLDWIRFKTHPNEPDINPTQLSFSARKLGFVDPFRWRWSTGGDDARLDEDFAAELTRKRMTKEGVDYEAPINEVARSR